MASLLGLWLVLTGSPLAADEQPRPFAAGSYRQILETGHERALIVAFWSLDCAHCLEELPVLGAWVARHPGVRLVLVSTDAPDSATAIAATLREQGLARHESWVFADDVPERLRYEIDPRWRGELPRSTLRTQNGALRTILGKIDPAELDRWLAGPGPAR